MPASPAAGRIAGRLHAESLVMDSASESAVEGLLLEVLARASRRLSEGSDGEAGRLALRLSWPSDRAEHS